MSKNKCKKKPARVPYFQVYRDAGGQWRWRLRAGNGKVVADSAEGYRRRGDAERGVALVRAAHDAEARVEAD